MNSLNTAAIVTILALGSFALWAATEGGHIWTAETARRVAVQRSPLPLPTSIVIDDTRQGRLSLGQFKAPVLLMDFVFTRCPTVCIAMGAEFRDVQRRLAEHPRYADLRFLSISFDPADSVADMQDYLRRFRADTQTWSGARVADAEQRRALLDLLDVIAIPSPQEGFVHNAAIYIVVEGRVHEIIDFGDTQHTLARVLHYLEQPQ